MRTVSAMLYECTAEEVGKLPAGFCVIESDTLYDSIRIIHAQVDRVRYDKRFRYFLHKVPPVSFVGVQGARYGKDQKSEDFISGSNTVKSSAWSISATSVAPMGETTIIREAGNE